MRRAFGRRIILAGRVVVATVACGLDSLFTQSDEGSRAVGDQRNVQFGRRLTF